MKDLILSGRYHLLNRIGVGGMAYVYEAEDLVLKRKVAVKILKQQFIDDEEFLKKFENEAQSAASLNHPNIVNVYDVGKHEYENHTLHYIVMELIEGTTLKEVIRVQGPLSNSSIARIALQIARALRCAHEHNIIHRDIKPQNILIMKSGDVKVADFGIARISSNTTITYTSSILGTVHYISPEQAKGKFVDQKSDLYSLGVVMYEMATGEVPFDAENSVGIAIKHVQEDPQDPIELNPALDIGLNQIILRCLSKEPANRFFSANEFIRAIEHYHNYDDTVLIPGLDSYKEPKKKSKNNVATYKTPETYTEEEEEKKTGSGMKWIVLLTVIAILIGVAMIFLLHQHSVKEEKDSLIKVPNLIHMQEKQALEFLKEKGLEGNVVLRVADDSATEGQIIDQSISPDTQVKKGVKIDLTVSSGLKQVKIPDVKNRLQHDAEEMIKSSQLVVGRVEYEDTEDVEKNNVARTEPAAGTEVQIGSKVTIYVSRGKKNNTTSVPSLIGMDQYAAIRLLQKMDLVVGTISTQPSKEHAAGTVLKQSADAGTSVDKQSGIDLVISSGAPAEESSSTKKENDKDKSDHEDKKAEKKTIRLILTPPANKDKFEVKVYDVTRSKEDPIFEKVFKKKDIQEDGTIQVQIKAYSDSELEVYYDGKLAKSE